MEKLSFRQCTLKKLDQRFGLRRSFASSTLDQWMSRRPDLSELESGMVKHVQGILQENAEAWNEQELALSCIGPLFTLVNFSVPYRFNHFAERRIGTIVSGIEKDIELSGEPDGIVATGYWEPEVLMFAFSEYKKLLDPEGDPAGQALAAMLVGQALDQNSKPLYGCYVVGHDWRFLVLEGKEYTISQDFSAMTDEVYDIFRHLKALKDMILELTK